MDHLPDGSALLAARIYMQAFKNKFSPILGDSDRAVQVLRQNLVLDRCLTAFGYEKLVGVLGIQTSGGGFLNPTLKSLAGEYGVIGGCYRLAGLLLLHHETGPDEWHVDGIAVAPEARSKGIGTGLLGYLEVVALGSGIRKLSLEVVDANHGARSLYERLGFVETRRVSLWPFNRIWRLPFKSAILMVKTLPPPLAQFND